VLEADELTGRARRAVLIEVVLMETPPPPAGPAHPARQMPQPNELTSLTQMLSQAVVQQ
jgi:hypothetical protein